MQTPQQRRHRPAETGARRLRPCRDGQAAHPAQAPRGNPPPPAAARSRRRQGCRVLGEISGSAMTTATASPTNATSSLARTNCVISGGNAAVRNCSGMRSCDSIGRKISEHEHRVDTGHLPGAHACRCYGSRHGRADCARTQPAACPGTEDRRRSGRGPAAGPGPQSALPAFRCIAGQSCRGRWDHGAS